MADLDGIFDEQRAAFARHGAPSVADRRAALRKLELLVLRNRVPLAETLSEDFGSRSRTETEIAEVVGSAHSLRYARRHLPLWTLPRLRGTSIWFLPGTNRVVAQPKGVVGIIAPWNYPVHLTLAPLAAAVAAGNRAMVKMSELTPSTAALLARLVAEQFPEDEIFITGGEVEVARQFSALPFDHLLFTGSTAVGREVMRAAAENLTPVTLELGGKSPAVVDAGYPIDWAASRITWGKLFNAGQTCIAPDYVLVPQGSEQRFADAAVAAARKLQPGTAGDDDVTSIVSDRHYERIRSLVDDARAKGATVTNAVDPETVAPHRHMPFTVVTGLDDGMRLAQEEIFGPVLPVIGYPTLDDAVGYVNARPRPLALYVFSKDGSTRRRILSGTTSGGVTVNDTLLHYLQDASPFGGIGPSGMGAYHGREGFDTFSHHKSVFTQRGVAGLTGTQMLYPPYGRLSRLLLRLMRRI
jgi:acyl-CoA reductase-like NAD-dependent aldehyde dehydrogenase